MGTDYKVKMDNKSYFPQEIVVMILSKKNFSIYSSLLPKKRIKTAISNRMLPNII